MLTRRLIVLAAAGLLLIALVAEPANAHYRPPGSHPCARAHPRTFESARNLHALNASCRQARAVGTSAGQARGPDVTPTVLTLDCPPHTARSCVVVWRCRFRSVMRDRGEPWPHANWRCRQDKRPRRVVTFVFRFFD